jgi:hypothetical protein
MAFKRDGYYYDQQLRNYVLQFMAIFSGLQVQVGKWGTETEKLISVPIHYGHPDRVVAAIISENTQNKPIRLPVMSAFMRTLESAPDRRHGTGLERRNTYVPVGGLIPNDMQVIHQRMPIPYNLGLDLCIYVSNTDQHFQILEQVLPLFDPQLNIQTSDAPFDMTRLTCVELVSGPMLDTNDPIGIDNRIIRSTLTFTMPIWIDTPADVRRDFVERIYVRVGAVSAGAITSEEIVAELDGDGIPYQLIQDAGDLPIQ